MIVILIRKLDEATNYQIEKNEKNTDMMVILLNEKEHFQSA